MTSRHRPPGPDERYAQGLDTRAIRRRFGAAVRAASPALVRPAATVLAGVASDQWELEWQLPRWLGQTLGLAAEDVEALAVCNMLGLVHVRVVDDLTDGGASGGPRRAAAMAGPMALASVSYTLAISGYTRLVGARAPDRVGLFADRVDRHMSRWAAAMLAEANPGSMWATGRGRALTKEGAALLAARGAPLKIGLAAACLIAGRDGAYGALDGALERVLLALVLVDHYTDWQADLGAGRYNAFTAFVSRGAQDAAHREKHRVAVMRASLSGDAVNRYFDVVAGCLAGARVRAARAGCEGLCAYIDAVGVKIGQFGRERIDAAREMLREAAAMMFERPAA